MSNDKTAKPKFCPECGAKLDAEAKFCAKCGTKIGAKVKASEEKIIVNVNNVNTNTNTNINPVAGNKKCNKWVSLLLCIFLGFFGAHKFYEGKIGMGILYIFTGGLFMIGVIVDLIVIIFKPNPYYV